jgi:hypothetical protein
MRIVLAIVALVLGAVLLRAEPDAQLRTAAQELKLAKTYLDSVRGSYGGHRRRALEHVKRASQEIKLGLLDAAVAREHGEPHPHAR